MNPTPLPRTRRRGQHPARAVLTVLAVVALVAVAGCGSGTAPVPHGAVYAALGDSESAGAGIAPIADSGCLRSKRNYPSLVQRTLHYSSFEDVSCSGAMTTNLLRPQLTQGSTNDPQLDALGSRTKLVTLTIGLNDDKLAYGLLAACVPAAQPTPLCAPVLQATTAQVDQQLSKAAVRVRDTLRAIRKAAPHARVVLVGYPRYLPDSGSCPDRYSVVAAMEPRLRSALRVVNQKWKAAAAAAGADYVDTYAMSKGHDVCSADPWVNGSQEQPGRAVALHPFEAFHEAVAKKIVTLLKQG
ncbi:SGNH/GDSL hydrolase family protein [Nocardioides pocheonensis]|uniref:SGNH/GDSL hydrolase family protein n=1 Tax=Nocardioides pocheonensis TaxID=661485 RepID=A0A3N0GZ15_9ACTN|nr:SGNH/GDSL hydrolase family protein [Nocardioides pocheonensis]RNM17456.1 SGNH/GDSL hydrolase family protein [Nocardioides pocheonensis]